MALQDIYEAERIIGTHKFPKEVDRGRAQQLGPAVHAPAGENSNSTVASMSDFLPLMQENVQM